jgi:hypothetical protein
MKDIYRFILPVPINGKMEDVPCKCTPYMNGSFIGPQDFEALAPNVRQPWLAELRKRYDVIGTASEGFRVYQLKQREFSHGKINDKRP